MKKIVILRDRVVFQLWRHRAREIDTDGCVIYSVVYDDSGGHTKHTRAAGPLCQALYAWKVLLCHIARTTTQQRTPLEGSVDADFLENGRGAMRLRKLLVEKSFQQLIFFRCVCSPVFGGTRLGKIGPEGACYIA